MTKKKVKGNKAKKRSSNSNVKDLMDTSPANITVIYGLSGTGKTTLLGTFPKPLLIIDVNDRGVESAKYKGLKKGDIEVFKVNTFDEIFDALDYARDKEFATVGIDHLSALQDYAYTKVMDAHGKKFMHQNFYGESSSLMKEVIMQFNELVDEGIQPVYLAQQRTTTEDAGGGEVGDDEDELIPEVMPLVQPAVATMLMTTARILVQTHIQAPKSKKGTIEMEYRLRTGASPYYRTKVTRQRDTTPCPKYIVNPTWEKIEQIITGEYKAPTKKKKKRGSK